MVAITYTGLLSGGPESYRTGITDLDIHMRGGAPVLYAASGPSGGVSSFRIEADGAATFLDRASFPGAPLKAAPGQLEELDMGSQKILLTLGWHASALACFDLDAAGAMTGTGQLTAQGGLPAAVVAMETLTVDGKELIYAGLWGRSGLTVYELGPGEQLVERGQSTGSAQQATGPQGAGLVAIEAVDIAGQSYLMTASALGDTVTSYRIGAEGLPVEVDTLSAVHGLGIAAPTALVQVSVAGGTYLVLAAAGSSSLSVLSVAPDGRLGVTDHIIDDLGTRFAGVTALETVTLGDRVFLIAGGADDGLSLLTVLPGGRLLHLGRIVSDAGMPIGDITALAATARDGGIDVFAAAEGADGIVQLRVEPGALGATKSGGAGGDALTGTAAGEILSGGGGNDDLTGGAGDDILMDGAGIDTLRGGAGADIFVLTADGQTDYITGFEIGVDRLDLSAFGLIRNLGQIAITATPDGARISFGAEEIRITSASYDPLPAAAFGLGDLLDVAHYTVVPQKPEPPIYGGGGSDVLTGTPAPDRLFGNAGNDRLYGLAEDDELSGGAGDDGLFGDDGDDTLKGEAGNDTLQSGAGNDRLEGGPGIDRLYGRAGDDSLLGGDDNDTLAGEDGFDTLHGGRGADVLLGGNQSDSLLGGGGGDRMYGQAAADTLLGEDGDDWLWGGEGGDLLLGGRQNDQLFGGAGDDTLRGEGGNDTLEGSIGNDLLEGGVGDDRHYGRAGDDILRGGGGNDTLAGENGDDTLDGGTGRDTILGGADNDLLQGGGAEDKLYGDGGDDTLKGDDGNDSLWGGVGSDRLEGGSQADSLFGGDGDDTLLGDAGPDMLLAGAGNDSLRGGVGNDTLAGEAGNDRLEGEDGNDRLYGRVGNDRLDGGGGNDTLAGGSGADTLLGGTARDVLLAGDDNDWLDGGGAEDKLYGEGGADRLDGGAGNDTLWGGAGSDTFVFTGGFGRDVIADFNAHSSAEKIDLSGVASITSYYDLQKNHMTRVGADIEIDAGGGNVILVRDIAYGALDAGDFIF